MHTAASQRKPWYTSSLRGYPCAGAMLVPRCTCHPCDAPRCALTPPGRQTNPLLPSGEVCSPLLVLPQSYGASSGPPPCGAHQRTRIQLAVAAGRPTPLPATSSRNTFLVSSETRRGPRPVRLMRPGMYRVLGLSQSAFQPPATPPRLHITATPSDRRPQASARSPF